MGLTFADLEQMDYGTVIDVLIEAGNDKEEWHQIANQDDFDRF